MKNVFFITISLDSMAGGLEKNLVNISNHLSEKNYKINILTFDLINSKSFYKIRKEIKWFKVGISKPHLRYTFFNKIKLIYSIRKILKKNNIEKTKVICFHHGILPRIFFSIIGLSNIQILCSERNSLSIYKYVKKSKFNFSFFLLFFVKKIIVQFNEFKYSYPYIYQKKIITINNIVDKLNIKYDTKKKTILNIGRLSTQKKQIDLIKIFEKIAPKCPDWYLKIIGDGDLEAFLFNYINQSKYKSQIKIIKPISDLSDIYSEASIFCLTSQWEGFPNALAEALSAKIPSICFDSCEGANILIKNGYNGFKVLDNEEFSKKLLLLIQDKNLLERFSINASRISEEYHKNKIIEKWEQVINE